MSGIRYAPAFSDAATRIKAMSKEAPSGCWEWLACVDPYGYGRIHFARKSVGAHRVSYEAFRGPIPDDLTIDHLCFNTRCVNPDHMRLLGRVENARNLLRAFKTHCVHGHEFTPENTGYQSNRRNPSGSQHRFCRECRRESDRRRRSAA